MHRYLVILAALVMGSNAGAQTLTATGSGAGNAALSKVDGAVRTLQNQYGTLAGQQGELDSRQNELGQKQDDIDHRLRRIEDTVNQILTTTAPGASLTQPTQDCAPGNTSYWTHPGSPGGKRKITISIPASWPHGKTWHDGCGAVFQCWDGSWHIVALAVSSLNSPGQGTGQSCPDVD